MKLIHVKTEILSFSMRNFWPSRKVSFLNEKGESIIKQNKNVRDVEMAFDFRLNINLFNTQKNSKISAEEIGFGI